MSRVFAVADSDEWDDVTHPSGQFNSTLKSPEFPVSGSSATLSFASHYKMDGPQSGKVTVRYINSSHNVISSQDVKTYGSTTNVNTVEKLPLSLPSGTTAVKAEFNYTGTNSYFWTVDQVKVQ
ncbi:hypothetical protein ACH41H_45050 [Streptomyces sp. NPDC020800]|uniref:hypothetical protein n=1 Tax=Streptomyces sp. NPDC020800 TaxID=3365092 RepID=UPI0037A88558